MKEMLIRKLKQERIFGYSSYGEFVGDYFKNELVAIEDLNRVRWLKESRKTYENRWRDNPKNHYASNYGFMKGNGNSGGR